MRQVRLLFCLLVLIAISSGIAAAQNVAVDASMPPPPREKKIVLKHVLVIGQTKGFEHDSVTDAMVAIYNMGRETGLWETVLRTHGPA